VARHARAQRVRVGLARIGQELRLEIEDDAAGFPSRTAKQPHSVTPGRIASRFVARRASRAELAPGASLEVRVPFTGRRGRIAAVRVAGGAALRVSRKRRSRGAAARNAACAAESAGGSPAAHAHGRELI